MSLIQNSEFPRFEVPEQEGPFSYRNRWDEVMRVFVDAGFTVREPPPRRRAESPCADFAWFFVVEGLDRHNEVLVTDQPIDGDREEAILRGAFAVVRDHPDAALHIYAPGSLSQRLTTSLSDTARGRFLRRVSVEIPIGEIRPKGVPHVAPRIAALISECWGEALDLDVPGDALEKLDDIVMEYRAGARPDAILASPGAILTPPLAALGIVVAEILRRHLPGPAKVHAAIPRAEATSHDDDRLKSQDWAFVMAVAGADQLHYVYGPGKVFTRYCQGDEQMLVDLVPREIAHPESEAALDFVRTLDDGED